MNQAVFHELVGVIERSGRRDDDFRFSVDEREPGWLIVGSGRTRRSYPIRLETVVLLSTELRHGIFEGAGRRNDR